MKTKNQNTKILEILKNELESSKRLAKEFDERSNEEKRTLESRNANRRLSRQFIDEKNVIEAILKRISKEVQ